MLTEQQGALVRVRCEREEEDLNQLDEVSENVERSEETEIAQSEEPQAGDNPTQGLFRSPQSLSYLLILNQVCNWKLKNSDPE